MNNPFEQEKKNYDATPIPEELDERVRAGIAEGRRRAAARRRFRSLTGIAACMVLMVGALNVSPAFAAAAACKGKPTVVLAKTVKGKGVSFMENQAGWHGKAPNDEQYGQARAELEGK